MTPTKLQFATVPAWALPPRPDALALFEVLALSDLEGKWIRLTAATQRAIMGHAPFGKQEFRVLDGNLSIRRSTCWGGGSEQASYELRHLLGAVAQRQVLSPGCFGFNYYEPRE